MGKHRKPEKKPSEKSSGGQNGHFKGQRGKPSKSKASALTLQPRPEWHTADVTTTQVPETLTAVPLPLLEKVHVHAKELLDAETKTYAGSHLQSSSAHKFYTTIMKSGTWSDKVSALTLLVQESPLHNASSFESLIGLSGKKNRQQALMALGAVKDMLAQGVMLPSERKLRMFTKQPALLAAFQDVKTWSPREPLPRGLQDSHLILWAFEDWLKHKYFEILQVLETWLNDEVEFSRMRAVSFVWELFKEKPEQEENLLRLLVNKLGDTSKKVASKASHLLLQTQVSHPSMKSIITSAVESEVLLRPGQSAHAKYYAVITLNQTVLSIHDPDTANKLLDVYFGLFVTFLNRSKHNTKTSGIQQVDPTENPKKRKRAALVPADEGQARAEQELEEKVIAQILTGINRAFPFSKADSETFEKHLNTMFRITHSSNFNTSIQALMLIQQISTTHHISTDRFMRTLYESLLDPRLLKSSKHTMYLNLLYRALKTDVSLRRVKAFVKRLLQILSLHDPPFVSAVLYLVIELSHIFPGVRAMLEQSEALDEDEEEAFHDVPSGDDEPAVHPDRTTSFDPKNAYDGRKRDPEHSNADRTCLWEVQPWLWHYHPSVSLFSHSLLAGGAAPPKPDPSSHTLIHFLDRFAYRNAKTRHLQQGAAVRGTSLMQPALGNTATTDVLLRRDKDAATLQDPVNREAFWSRRAEEVAPDEVFFHRYFGDMAPKRKRADDKKRPAARGADPDEWNEEVGADEDEIWKALVGSRPELGGDEADVDASDSDMDVGAEMDGSSNSDGDDDGFDELDDDEEGEFDEDDEGVELNLESDDDDAMFGSEDEGDEDAAEVELPAGKGAKDKEGGDDDDGRKKKKRKMKSLPIFASADDYAKMIEEDDEPDGGR